MASTISQRFISYGPEDGYIESDGLGGYTVDKTSSPIIYTSSSSDTVEARTYLFLETGNYFANNFPSATITSATFSVRYTSGAFDGFGTPTMLVIIGNNVIGGTLEAADFTTFAHYSYPQIAADFVMDQISLTTYSLSASCLAQIAKTSGTWTNIMLKMSASSSTSSYTYISAGPTNGVRNQFHPRLDITFTHNLNTYTTSIPAITGSPSKLSVPSKLSSPTFFRNP